MIDPALTFDTTAEAVAAREQLLTCGVFATIGQRNISYWIGQQYGAQTQLGKSWSAKQHRPYTHFAVGPLRTTKAGKVAITFGFRRSATEHPPMEGWTVLPISRYE